MQCVVLAGGLGTRMKKIAGDRPKALLPVGPRTFIDWQLQWLKRLGATEVVLALAFKSDEFRAHVEACTKKEPQLYPRVTYSFDGPGSQAGDFLGTGGATRQAAASLGDDFCVTYGDTFLFLRLGTLLARHRQARKAVTFSIFKNAGAGDTSNVEYRDGQIVRYDKFNLTPAMDHIDYGMFAVRKADLLAHTPPGASDLAPYLSQACARGEMAALVAREPFREIGSPAGYRGFCELLAANGHDLSRLGAKAQ
jgi:NDP-sugar pyrophosphorylase family protein